jgi:L-amino acid N-acyltransferase YncA
VDLVVEGMKDRDWPRVAEIFASGIATGDATFESSVPSWDEWDADHLDDHRLVARRDGVLVGWAALSAVSDRCAYGGVAEVSVYVASEATGSGVGRRLLDELIDSSERGGIWTLQAQIFPENEVSIALHHKAGFRTVGVRERLGQMDGRWRDVILLERRSPTL